jgi:excinuclease UvrABC ATPase subunit
MPLNELIAFIDLYKEHNNKDKNLVARIVNPLIDRAKTIQDLGLGYLSLKR